jgi:ABC-type antimicrobial peptide transport system permease subunit
MRLRIIIKLAFKNLFSHKLRTSLTVIGVTIGIGAIVFLVSMGYGLEKLVTSQVANFNAFTVIDVPAANLKTLKLDNGAVEKIQGFGHIEKIAPVINLAGRVKKPDSASSTETVIVGANNDYWKMSDTAPEKGALPSGESSIVVNHSFMSLMGENSETMIGQSLDLDVIIPKELRNNEDDGIKVAEGIKVKVVGITKDDKTPVILVSLELLAKVDAVKYSSLKLKADQKESVPGIRTQLENIGLSSEYVGDTVNEISQVFSLFRAILGAFGLIALVVAALGAFNTLTISLLERIREVGLFKALGMKNKDIYKLFMAESFIIGLSGGVLGLFIGESLGLAINMILTILAKRAGTDSITVFLTPFSFAVSVAIFSIIVGFLTGWYPARRAVKLNPLDALRYE